MAANPCHTYFAIGTFTVTLIAKSDPCPPDTFTMTVDISSTPGFPEASQFIESLDVYPNPFAKDLSALFVLKEAGEVEIAWLDLTGKELGRKALGNRSPGEHRVELPDPDFAPGIYFLRLETNGVAVHRKVIRR